MKSSTALKNALLGSTGWAECFPTGLLIDVYTGPAPANPEAGATGTKLGTVSLNGTGAALVTDAPVNGAINKPVGASWTCLSLLASGTAGYMRIYAHGGNPANDDNAAKRVDLTVGVAGSGADAIFNTTTFAAGDPFTLTSFIYELV